MTLYIVDQCDVTPSECTPTPYLYFTGMQTKPGRYYILNCHDMSKITLEQDGARYTAANGRKYSVSTEMLNPVWNDVEDSITVPDWLNDWPETIQDSSKTSEIIDCLFI